uniref:Uncharacterized protein n=1 Tax=Anguilla anguilla TaxID=7936 RepID=A0A0E9PI69_ANGAN
MPLMFLFFSMQFDCVHVYK